jgi:predicted MFS family arabinose efflux permease
MRLVPDMGGLPRTFWVVWTGTLINRLGGFVHPFLAIYLTSRRGLSVEEAGIVVALVGFGSIGAGPVGGALADRLGRRPALAISTVFGAGAMMALSVARTLPGIAVAALVLGWAGDLYRPVAQTIVADVVPELDRPRAYGLLHWVVNIGFAVSVGIAGWMADKGFALLFVADAVTTLLFGAVVVLSVPETRPNGPPREGRKGAFFRPYRDGRFLMFAALSLLGGTIFTNGLVTLPVEMRAHGVSNEAYGALIALNGAMIIVLQPYIAPLVRRYPHGHVLALGTVLTGGGYALMGITFGYIPAYAASIAVWTLGEIVLAPVGPAVVADMAPAESQGSYQGAYQMSWSAASFLGPAVGSLVMGRFGANVLWASCGLMGVTVAAGFVWFLSPRRRANPR